MVESWRPGRGAPSGTATACSPELEEQAKQWIEAVTQEPFQGSFAEEVRDGRRLCLLINHIRPGLVRKVNDSKMPFKQMENVSNFLKACRAVGVPEYSLFETVDLFELKDIGLVIQCLHALGGTAQLTCPEFTGPHLGLKPAQKTPAPGSATGASSGRGSSRGVKVRAAENGGRSALSNGRAAPSGGEDSSSPNVKRSPPPPYDPSAPRWSSPKGANGVVANEVNGRERRGDGLPPPPAYHEVASKPYKTVPKEEKEVASKPYRTLPKDEEEVATRPYRRVPEEEEEVSTKFSDAVKVSEKTSGGKVAGGSSNDKVMEKDPAPRKTVPKDFTPPKVQASKTTVPVAPAKVELSHPQNSSGSTPQQMKVTKTRGGGFGLDAELAAKREANYDYQSEYEAQEWIEAVTGEPFTQKFGEELRDGRRLCILINAIQPGAVRRVNSSSMPFKQMENISNFLKACRSVGVAEHSLFETVDLFEGKDLGLVVRCLHALGQTVQKTCPEYNGPTLGIKQADANVREWTPEQQEEQLRASSNAITSIMAGSSSTMERETVLPKGVTFGADTVGTGDSTVQSRWTMGSQSTMERTTVSRTGPTFGAEYAGTGDKNSTSRVTQGFR